MQQRGFCRDKGWEKSSRKSYKRRNEYSGPLQIAVVMSKRICVLSEIKIFFMPGSQMWRRDALQLEECMGKEEEEEGRGRKGKGERDL